MKIEDLKILEGFDKIKNKHTLVTRKSDNKVYILQMFVASDDLLVPLQPHYNNPKGDLEYYTHFYAKNEDKIKVNTINFNDYSITKEEYKKIQKDSKQQQDAVLFNFHSKF